MVHSRDHYRLLSEPMDVYWAGWKSTTCQLQQAGWELSAEEDIRRCTIRIALRHRDLRITGISNSINYNFLRDPYAYQSKPPIHIQWMASDIIVTIHDNLDKFRPIDAFPQVVTTERKSIEDFGIFATPLVRTEEIIVEPADVAELLERIKQMQAPEQSAIRARNRLRESRQGIDMTNMRPRQQFHAQILSIAA